MWEARSLEEAFCVCSSYFPVPVLVRLPEHLYDLWRHQPHQQRAVRNARGARRRRGSLRKIQGSLRRPRRWPCRRRRDERRWRRSLWHQRLHRRAKRRAATGEAARGCRLRRGKCDTERPLRVSRCLRRSCRSWRSRWRPYRRRDIRSGCCCDAELSERIRKVRLASARPETRAVPAHTTWQTAWHEFLDA